MRKIYLFLIVTICTAIILFVATFFYIDTHRHTIFLYNVYQDKRPVATVTVDKYNTEDMVVYKSATNTPFHSTYDIHKRKLSIEKKGQKIHSYNKKHLSEGVNMDINIRRVNSTIDFLALGHSNFAYAKRLPFNKDSVIFEEDAIISYFNLMDKYDFTEGGLQTLSCLTHTYTFLPPYKSEIEVKFIDEELISLDEKKIKALHFRIKLPDKKEIFMWVNRWTHIPLIIKVPKTGFEALYTEALAQISAKKHMIEGELYKNREITFKNKDITLAGTLSVPNGDGPFPAIILVWGPGPIDRDGLGIFTDMADNFAKNGIAVLRFDKRGVGKSEGNFSKFTGDDIIEDLSRAVDFLIQQKEIDKKRLAILGHSEGGYYAASLAANSPYISACIIMAGIEYINLPDTDLEMIWTFDKSALNWDKKYLEDIAKTAKDTYQISKSGKDWAFLLQKRVYVKKRYLDIEKKPSDVVRKVKIPILILRGKRDTVTSPEHINLIEGALKEGGNKDYEVIYFNRLDYFFGNKVEDGIHRTRLSIDKEVTDTILKWLNKNLISLPLPKEEPVIKPVIEGVTSQEELIKPEEIKTVEPEGLKEPSTEKEMINPVKTKEESL